MGEYFEDLLAWLIVAFLMAIVTFSPILILFWIGFLPK